MVKKGDYAVYKGKEYEFVKKDNKQIYLVSKDKEDLSKGFTRYNSHIYRKLISIKEADELYYINPKAKYKGEIFYASEGGSGKVLLDTNKASLAGKYGFERTDKYMYSKYVGIDEVEIIEEKDPL